MYLHMYGNVHKVIKNIVLIFPHQHKPVFVDHGLMRAFGIKIFMNAFHLQRLGSP